jgi:hypothetical protein
MKPLFIVLLLVFISINTQADLAPNEEQYVKMMKSGDLRELKQAAKIIHREQIKTPKVLDVATEILLQLYPSATKNQYDTLSWLALAIGQSGNGRYFSALTEVSANITHKKIRKHAIQALKNIPAPSEDTYKKGTEKLLTTIYF